MKTVNNVRLDRVDVKYGRFEFPDGRLRRIAWSQVVGGAMEYDPQRPLLTIQVTDYLHRHLRLAQLVE